LFIESLAEVSKYKKIIFIPQTVYLNFGGLNINNI